MQSSPTRIVPVIDLMDGLVVQAKAGQREHYRPLQSPYCPSAEPQEVLAGLLRLHPFATFYLADLNALMGKEPQHGLLSTLVEAHPHVTFWVDAGWPAPAGPWTTVIGTESLNTARWNELKHAEGEWILSLDFFAGHLRGPQAVLAEPEQWPERVIAMTLHRVGGLHGPDWATLGRLRALAPEKQLIAAGGVRDGGDLRRLWQLGITTALVASALHAGRLQDCL